MEAKRIAVHAETGRAAWQVGSDIYIGSESGGIEASRWESTRSHWDRWFESIHQPNGWKTTEGGSND